MFTVQNTFNILDIKGDFTKTLNKEIGIAIRLAAKEWLRAVLVSIHGAPHTDGGDSFPVQTGEAKGSLIPIGRVVGMNIDGITPAPGKKDRSGVGESGADFELVDDNMDAFKYSFKFNPNVMHFVYNEFNHNSRIKSGTPWKSLLAGNAAFRTFMRERMAEKIPKIIRAALYVRRTYSNG